MKEVVIDTNFLLLPYQFKVDIFGELQYLIEEPFQIVVSSKVVGELKALAKRVGKAGAGARVALKLLDFRKQNVKSVSSGAPVDDWVFEYSVANHSMVATNDLALKDRLKKARVKVIGLRGRTKIGYV